MMVGVCALRHDSTGSRWSDPRNSQVRRNVLSTHTYQTKPSFRRTAIPVVNLKAYTSFRALSRACATLRHTTKTSQKPVRASFNSASQALFINRAPLYTSKMASLDDKSRSLIQKAYPEAIQAEADMIKLSSTMFPKAEVQSHDTNSLVAATPAPHQLRSTSLTRQTVQQHREDGD